MNGLNFSIILNKLLEVDPVSGISVIFTLIFFLYSKGVIKSLEMEVFYGYNIDNIFILIYTSIFFAL